MEYHDNSKRVYTAITTQLTISHYIIIIIIILCSIILLLHYFHHKILKIFKILTTTKIITFQFMLT